MGCRPDGWWRDRAGASRRLVELMGAWASRTGKQMVAVFDAAPPEPLRATPDVEVRFAERSGRDAADDVIAALVAASPAPQALQVVTSDAALARRVRAHGAAVTGARAFRDSIDPPA